MNQETILNQMITMLQMCWEREKAISCHFYDGSHEIFTYCTIHEMVISENKINILADDDMIISITIAGAELKYDDYEDLYFVHNEKTVFVIGGVL